MKAHPSKSTPLALLAVCVLVCGCGLFSNKKEDPPPQTKQPAKPVPALEQQSGSSDWGDRIGSSAYKADHSAIENAGVSSHSDRIGAGQIDQLKAAGPSSAPKIAAFLADPSPQVRAKAVEALGSFGAKAESALGNILEVLRNVEPAYRLSAAQAFAAIGSPKVRDHVQASLRDPSPAVQAWIRATLVIAGEGCASHQAATARILSGSLGRTPGEAAAALATMNCANPEAIRLLQSGLSNADERVRAAAARALGHIGKPAASSVPKLVALLADRKAFRARMAATLALAQMGSEAAPAVKPLTEMLKDPAPRFRELAAHSLGKIGSLARSASGPLEKATRDQEPTVQAAAKKALARINGSSLQDRE